MKKNVLVTAVGGRSVGSGILHALTRSSGEVSSRWNVVAADADPFAWGLYKVEDRILLPTAKSSGYIDRIKEAINQYSLSAIIPGSEAEASVLSGQKELFNIPIISNKHEIMPLMMDKFQTMKKLEELGLPVIPTYEIHQWEEVVRHFGFPVILKPTTGTGGSKGVSLCTNEKEIEFVLKGLDDNSGYCVQPLIGSENEEYTVGVLSDKDGAIIDSIVMKRKLVGLSLLSSKNVGTKKFSISTGYSQGYFIKHPMIQDFCEKLALSIGSAGPLNIQLRIHEGEIYVFEIHPRFSGTTTMRADVGLNEPDLLLRNHINGEKFGRIPYKTDVAVIRAFEHVVVPIAEML